MELIAVNIGSSSIKLASFRMEKGQAILLHKINCKKEELVASVNKLASSRLRAIVHRVVHGGKKLLQPTLLTTHVKSEIRTLSAYAPLHNPLALEGIETVENLFPDVSQYAVFDTSFFQHMPETAKVYPIPYHFYEEGIQRYGFHGLSHAYCTKKVAELLQTPIEDLKIISCHIGSGISIAAVDRGKAIDTSMGFTPLDGVMMATRSGAIDPGILLYLQKKTDLEKLLWKESGWYGLTGTKDFKEIVEKMETAPEAKLAVEMLIRSLSKAIAGMLSSLNGADVILFTGGIGENQAYLRNQILDRLSFCNIKYANTSCSGDYLFHEPRSATALAVIQTEEELEMARQVLPFLST